ncbi:MAG TPA: 30S ribosomal protein S12 methylthiotransferase RimO, partial [Terriglobales bacterium]|nr:30S ribosomal protein S12 methylthiotransferase RimO [Terriglobales bacterium]
AFHLAEKVPAGTIERRRKRLMQIQRQISKRKRKALVGREFNVVLEGPSEETDLLWEGRTEMHAPEIDGKVFINDFGDHAEARAGGFYRCQITEAHDYDLVARLV